MIDFEKYSAFILQFLSSNILITIALGIALVIFFYKKPEGTIKFLAFCALLVAVLYVMSMLSDSSSLGVRTKEGGVNKSERVLSDSPQ